MLQTNVASVKANARKCMVLTICSSNSTLHDKNWKCISTQIAAWRCLLKLYSWLQNVESNQDTLSNSVNNKNKILKRSPFVGEWKNCDMSRQWNITQRHELSSHEKTCRELICILLCERSWSEEAIYCMIPKIWFWKRQNYGDGQIISDCQG